MSKEYTPSDWFWLVGDDQSRAYSSKVGDYVPANDAAFVAWKADGTSPSRIASAAELGAVLAQLSLRPAADGVLAGYLDSQIDDVVIKKLFKIIFNQENRLRALEGKQPITVAQARAAFRGLL